jgi:hypothetical protein
MDFEHFGKKKARYGLTSGKIVEKGVFVLGNLFNLIKKA